MQGALHWLMTMPPILLGAKTTKAHVYCFTAAAFQGKLMELPGQKIRAMGCYEVRQLLPTRYRTCAGDLGSQQLHGWLAVSAHQA